jgi:hypothetical protein
MIALDMTAIATSHRRDKNRAAVEDGIMNCLQ